MRPRLVVLTVAVLALAITAGCLGSGPTQEDLQEDQTYEWNTDATVTYDLERGSLFGGDSAKAIFVIDGREEVKLYRQGITRTRPVSVRSVQFRYPNGTVETYDPAQFEVERTDRETRIEPPASEGRLGVTIRNRARSHRITSNVNGSHAVVLPPEHRATDLLLGDITPRGYETTRRGDRQVIDWDDLDADRPLVVRYYLARDRLLFYGASAVLLLVGGGIVLYYRRKLRELRRLRKEHGLDVDADEADDDDPPPGFG